MWNERKTIRFINFIVLFIRRKSNFVSRVTCLSLDNNFESSTLFALFPDFPTSPIVPIIYGFTHKLKGTSNYTPFYPARGTVDTLGCTWNAIYRIYKIELRCIKNFTFVNYPMVKYRTSNLTEQNKIWRKKKKYTTFSTHTSSWIKYQKNRTIYISRAKISLIPTQHQFGIESLSQSVHKGRKCQPIRFEENSSNSVNFGYIISFLFGI